MEKLASAEERLRDAERELRLRNRALEAASTGIVIVDALAPDQPVVYVNPAFVAMTGYTKDDIVGLNCRILQSGDCTQPALEELRAALVEGRSCRVVLRNYRKDGVPFWNELTVSPVQDEDGRVTHFLGIQNDITHRIETEEALKEATVELEEHVRERTAELERANEELEGFTHSVSHDLRAPMRSIMGFSTILMEDYAAELSPEARQQLQRISSAAGKMQQIIEDLLTYSRVGRKELRREPVDLSGMAEAIGADLVRRHPDRSTVIGVDRGITAVGDPTLLRMVLENLLDNAYKFTSKRPDGKVELRKVDEHHFVVRDNGAGFEPQYADKLFKPFERLHSDRDYPGTGIGLANVKRIVERHGGKIWAEGKPNEGAAFHVLL